MTTNNALLVLNEILQDLRQSTAPQIADDDFFEIFSAEQVLRYMRFACPKVEDGIVGGGNDGGIDSSYLFVNGRYLNGKLGISDFDAYKKNVELDWVLIQAKRESSFREDTLPKIKQTLSDAFDPSIDVKTLKITYKTEVIEAIERFRVARRALQASGVQINIHVYYVCKGDTQKVDVKIGKAQKESLIGMVEATIPGNKACAVVFIGARELADLASKVPPTKRELAYSQVLLIKGGGYIAVVALDDYYRFITENGDLLRYLFESNVRDYLEDADVNKDIRESLQTPTAEDFWMLNNGITVLAESIQPGTDSLVVEDPQIVNGLQTSEEIFNYCQTSPNPDHLKRRVVVRIVTSTSPDSQDRIIKATNRQSGITAAQLHATEQVHRDIEKMFPASGLFYDRRLKYWKYKDKPRDQVISIQALSQCLMAIYQQRPDTARARPGDVFTKKNVALYGKLFDPATNINFYVTCAHIQRLVDQHLKAKKLERALANDIKFYVSMIVSVKATGKTNPSSDDLAKLNLSSITSAAIEEAYNIAHQAYLNQGADQDASKGPEMLAEIKSTLGIV
ncbi:MAG TPA: AIPR family protein [Terracidiphilus sp.]|nr:AIPR family protein [Terracidiphilus sp.]